LTTLGLLAGVIIPATIGLALVGSAGVASAAGIESVRVVRASGAGIKPVGVSPASKVVKLAPTAVSVTFAGPLRAGDASLRVITESGADVGKGKVSTSHKTLRRQLRVGAPGGKYLITWKAVTKTGHKVSGSFRFTAAHGNGPASASLGPAGQPIPVGGPTPSEAFVTPDPTPTGRVTSDPRPTQAGPAGPVVTLTPSGAPSGMSTGSGGTLAAAAPAVSGPHRGQKDRGVSRGFTLVPLAVGTLLVLVAGLVARFNRPSAKTRT
jgi:methionine-rich copper-binding protein CopC